MERESNFSQRPSVDRIFSCANCGTRSAGIYCSQCGQKHRTPHDLRIGKFLSHVLEEFTHYDSKLFRSLKSLFRHPGALTIEWIDGREKSYVKPLQLFFIMNLVYFIFVHFIPFSTFTSPLNVQYSMQTYSPMIRPIVDDEVRASHLTFQKFSEFYNDTSAAQAKTLIIFMVPLFALILALLEFRKHQYYVEHLVFSLHFYSFFLIVASFFVAAELLLVSGVVNVMRIPLDHVDWDLWGTYPAGLVCFIYFFYALRRVYHDGRFFALIKSGVLTVCVLYIIFAYRFVLFFTTILTMQVKG